MKRKDQCLASGRRSANEPEAILQPESSDRLRHLNASLTKKEEEEEEEISAVWPWVVGAPMNRKLSPNRNRRTDLGT